MSTTSSMKGSMKVSARGVSVTFDGDVACAECGKPGASPSGLCITCLSRVMNPTAKFRSPAARALQARAENAVTEHALKGGAALRGALDSLMAVAQPIGDGEGPDARPSVALELSAFRFTLAWLNAFLATSDDEARPALYRTLAVECFPTGVQFVGCDGTMLFRTWCAAKAHLEAPMPLLEEAPDRTVVVMDVERFAVGFVRTLRATAGHDDNQFAPVELTIEPAPVGDAPMLGEGFAAEVLVLRAFGQRLSCRLYEGEFPDWRSSAFGLHPSEQVDGMRLSVRLFAAVGKLKGMLGVDCTFRGADRAIEIHGVGADAEVRGLLMPMRRDADRPAADATTSTENDD